MIQYPKTSNTTGAPTWNQTNKSDTQGSLWASTGIDVTENEGVLRIGKRLPLNTATADVAEITSYPVAFKVFGGKKFAIAGTSGTGYVFSQATVYPSAGVFSKVTGSNTPTNIDSLYSDMEVSNSALYVTSASNTVYWATSSSTWSTAFTVGASDSASAHMLTSYAGRTYMSKLSSLILSWDSNNTVATSGSYTLQLGNSVSNVITCMRSASNRIWICTINQNGGKGYIYEWDGVSSQPTKSYRLQSSGALACVIKDDVPYVMDTNGALLVWNGGTFKEIARINRRKNRLLYNPLTDSESRFIHPNGMSIINGRICLLIDGRNWDSTLSMEETIPSGIYEYDEERGLIHKGSLSANKSSATRTDMGQTRLAAVGALAESNQPSNGVNRNGTFLAGASFYTDATTITSGIFYDDSNDTLQKAGSFVTTKTQALNAKGGPSVQNMWQNLYVLYKKLLNANDKIVVKYRVSEAEPVMATITWASTTTFTVLNSAVDVSQYWTAGTGGEVEVLNGIGAGICSHITNAVNVAGTWTVTVDETYTGATGTAIARFQAWTKLGAILYNSPTANGVTYDQQGVNVTSNWIQFKVWMLFTGKDELEKLLIVNQDYNPVN